MNNKRKTRRAFILFFAVYIIINVFVFGFMKAYVNTNNIISKNHLVMASITENQDKTNIKILGKSFAIDKKNTEKTISEVCIYTLMTDKIRICTDLILQFREFTDIF